MADHDAPRLALRLIGVIVLAAALTGCGGEAPKPDVSKLLLAKAAPLCTQAFSNDRFARASASGSVKGPATVFVRDDDSRIEEKYRRYANSTWRAYGDHMVPDYARTTSADAVEAVVCYQRVYGKVGSYEIIDLLSGPVDVISAREDWDIRVIRWPSGEPVAATVLTGRNPPDRISVGPNSKPFFRSGEGPVNEGIRWIAGVITR